jgi:ParB/RepB/Spo0J family partition protein
MIQQATIALSDAYASPTNPRKHFDEKSQAELNESVAAKGILQPLLVRQVRGKKGHEVVCGERRRRAAVACKLKEIPVVIRDLDDAEALELQLIENNKRSDVHPLEEADGYQQLQRLGRSVEQIAAGVAKSQSHVYQRLRLCNLSPTCRKAFVRGDFEVVVATILSRVHSHEQQDKALAELEDEREWVGDEQRGPITVHDARQLVRDRYMLVLAAAPFSTTDAQLVPGAGACAACPKRSGAQRELFEGDAPKSDSCLDPTCYEKKAEASFRAAAKRAEDQGGKVLSKVEVEKIFPYGGSSLSHSAPFVRLADTCYDDPKKRTYKQLLGPKAKEAVVLARDPSGGVHELVRKTTAQELLRQAGGELAKEIASRSRRDTIAKAADRKRREEQARRTKLTAATIAAVVEEAGKGGTAVTIAGWKLLGALAVRRASHDAGSRACAARGLKVDAKSRPEALLSKQLAGMGPTHVPGFVLELLLSEFAYHSYTDKPDRHLEEAAKVYGVDVAKLRKELAAAEKVKQATAAAKAPAPKKRAHA